jgi:hypothetical protein
VHQLSTSFVLGYHGCSTGVAEQVLAKNSFAPSKNDHDWLGHGAYFWQSNPLRALQFAREKRARDKKDWEPTVLGTVIGLGFCLDLATESGAREVQSAYNALKQIQEQSASPLPSNSGGADRLLRKLDCAVIQVLHNIRQTEGLQPVDTVVGMFEEGGALYEGSGFRAKTHIQICVRNPSAIKGIFRVPASEYSAD